MHTGSPTLSTHISPNGTFKCLHQYHFSLILKYRLLIAECNNYYFETISEVTKVLKKNFRYISTRNTFFTKLLYEPFPLTLHTTDHLFPRPSHVSFRINFRTYGKHSPLSSTNKPQRNYNKKKRRVTRCN